MNDRQPTSSWERFPVDGRLSRWQDRGMEILNRLGLAYPQQAVKMVVERFINRTRSRKSRMDEGGV